MATKFNKINWKRIVVFFMLLVVPVSTMATECRDQGNPIATVVCSTQPNGGSGPLCH